MSNPARSLLVDDSKTELHHLSGHPWARAAAAGCTAENGDEALRRLSEDTPDPS